MLVADLEYLQPIDGAHEIEGAAYTYAKATADASDQAVTAGSYAEAMGDRVSIKTTSSVAVSSGRYITYSRAFSSAVAIAKTGYQYSVSVDYAFDANVSP